MDTQLHLLTSSTTDNDQPSPPSPPDDRWLGATWRLSERTRTIGRQGVASARAALAEGRRRDPDAHHTTDAA
jgi:hypothetical protein